MRHCWQLCIIRLAPKVGWCYSLRPLASPGVVVNVLDVDLKAEGDRDLSAIPPSSDTDIHSSLWADFSLIQEKCDEVSIDRQSNPRDIFWLPLRGVNTLDGQRLLIYYVEWLLTDECVPVVCVHLFHRQVAARPAELASGRSNMARLKGSFDVFQHQEADVRRLSLPCKVKAASMTALGTKMQRHGVLEALIGSLRCPLVDYRPLVN